MEATRQPQKVVVFDFDGTMADTAPIIRKIYSELAVRNRWKHPTDEDYKKLRRGSLNDARKWAGIPFWRLPLLIHQVKKLMRQEVSQVVLFPEVVDLVQDLCRQGFKVYILSRNLPETISEVLERYELKDKTQILHRKKRYFGTKSVALILLMRRAKYDNKYVYMVGDEVRDILAAKRAGVHSVAVGWGIQDISVLEKAQPTHTAANVGELRKILQQ